MLLDIERLVPTLEETSRRVVSLPLIQQFKNSLRFVNTSTNMTLDRMILALDRVGAECYLDGFNAGLIIAQKAFDASAHQQFLNQEAINVPKSTRPPYSTPTTSGFHRVSDLPLYEGVHETEGPSTEANDEPKSQGTPTKNS